MKVKCEITINFIITKSHSPSITHAVRLSVILTWLLVENLLELGPLVLCGLLQEVRPQTLDGEVNHVGLHQAQDVKDLPEGTQSRLRNALHNKILYEPANFILKCLGRSALKKRMREDNLSIFNLRLHNSLKSMTKQKRRLII